METGIGRRRAPLIAGTLAVAFGALSVLAGGTVLFGPQSVQAAAGNLVLPVLWFNVLSGPVYVLAGWAVLSRRSWARRLVFWLIVRRVAVPEPGGRGTRLATQALDYCHV